MGLIYKLTFLFHAVLTQTYVSLSFCNLATFVKLGGFEWNRRWSTQTCFTVLKTHILRAVTVTNFKWTVSNNTIFEILCWSYKIRNFLYVRNGLAWFIQANHVAGSPCREDVKSCSASGSSYFMTPASYVTVHESPPLIPGPHESDPHPPSHPLIYT